MIMRHKHGQDDVQAVYFSAITTLWVFFSGRKDYNSSCAAVAVSSSFMLPLTDARFDTTCPE